MDEPAWPMPNAPPGVSGRALPNPMRYELDIEHGVVRDLVTGLVWERRAPLMPLSWVDARERCASLELGGRRGFALPSLIELVSIQMPRGGGPGPMIDDEVFAGPVFGTYWSATPGLAEPNGPKRAWALDFRSASSESVGQGEALFTRCVARADAVLGQRRTEPRFLVFAEVVVDTRTGLVWQRHSSREPMGRGVASAYCRELGIEGGGFRLPSLNELQTIVDYRRMEPAIDLQMFPSAPGDRFWTMTVMGGDNIAYVDFATGRTGVSDVGKGYARCVR